MDTLHQRVQSAEYRVQIEYLIDRELYQTNFI